MTITKREVQPKARITYDEMEAFLTLPVPKEGEEYTLEELLALLEKNQIRHGIEQETLRKMLRERIYNKEVCIAVGTPVVDGTEDPSGRKCGLLEYQHGRACGKRTGNRYL